MSQTISELLKDFHSLALLSARLRHAEWLTFPTRMLPAGGVEVTGIRDYVPGDDITHIDWAACARQDEILTKVYERKVIPHAHVLVNCSPNMFAFDSAKYELGKQTALAVAYLAAHQEMPISIWPYADKLLGRSPTVKRIGQFSQLTGFFDNIIRKYEEQGPVEDEAGVPNNFLASVTSFVEVVTQPGPVVIIGDFLEDAIFGENSLREALRMLRKAGMVPRVVQINATAESQANETGSRHYRGVQTGHSVRTIVTNSMRKRYEQLFEQLLETVSRDCSECSATLIQVWTDVDREWLWRQFVCGE